ncbi:MAG: choice-of-anchor L domain-containing protein, partial [Phaeodactylibacter sp.]|nr:choice-of-anchor L domain-containing protein [Phaeodactylibacter sp.]
MRIRFLSTLKLLLVGVLLLSTIAFKNAPLEIIAEQRLHFHDPSDRQLVFLHDFEESIALCDLTPGATYLVQLNAAYAYELEDCLPVFYTFPVSPQKISDKAFRFVADANCANFTIVNSCGTAMQKLPAYLSITRQGGQGPKPIDLPEAPAISTNSSVSITSMITNTFIGGNCYEISNITSAGNNNAFGTFSNGLTSIGLDQGIVISSGNIANATGPNNDTGSTTDFGIFANEPDLAQIAAGGIRDRAVIEFDFTPSADMVQFDYVFASEEYCDYTNTTFNDVFGFFISGPGINGPYQGNAENIALIPGTTTAVSINNVNHVNNSAYYVGNIPAGSGQLGNPNCNGHPISGPPSTADCQFDGYTTVLTAMASVIPCNTYHIKLAIADVTDGLFDSAVFLAANSFDSGATADVQGFGTGGSSNIIYESCGDGYFLFTRDDNDDINLPLTITYTISGNSTATPGLDYTPIPLSVTIPAGQTSVQLPISVIADLIAEGTESIILLLDVPCQCSNKEIEILIEDTPPLELGVTDQQICESQSTSISAAPAGGLAPYTYQWSTGGTGQSINVSPTMDTEYYVTVTDDCGNMEVDTALVSVLPQPTAILSGTDVLCEGGSGPPAELTVQFTGTGPWELIYAIDGVQQPPITTSDNPYTLTFFF